jgi:hypothetical protein
VQPQVSFSLIAFLVYDKVAAGLCLAELQKKIAEEKSL